MSWQIKRCVADEVSFSAYLIHELLQIEGFKLHVSHNTKPFVNRVRYVPEVASKPGRIEKDLANVKILASILEEEYVTLFKSSASSTGGDSMETNGVAKPEDVGVQADNEDDPMQTEVGSEAVERRIEKLVVGLHEQGVDEKVLEAKKVSRVYVYTLKDFSWCFCERR